MKLWKKCGHPRTPENTANRPPSMPDGRCRICFKAAQARYHASEKGRAAQLASSRRREATDTLRAVRARYRRTENYRASKSRWNWRSYGIADLTWERFQATVKAQRGRCAVCGGLPNGTGGLHADHDHATEAFRGAVCWTCNLRIDRYAAGRRVTPDFAARCVEYLKRAA